MRVSRPGWPLRRRGRLAWLLRLQQPTEQAAGSLLHILQVNLRFSSSRRLPRDLVTSFLQSRLIGLIHVAGLVMALAMHSNNPRTQVAIAFLFCI